MLQGERSQPMNLDKRLLKLALDLRRPLAVVILCGWLAGVVTVFFARLLSRVVSTIFLPQGTLHGALGVSTTLALMLFLAVLRVGLVWAGRAASQRVAGGVKHRLRQEVSRRLFDLARVLSEAA